MKDSRDAPEDRRHRWHQTSRRRISWALLIAALVVVGVGLFFPVESGRVEQPDDAAAGTGRAASATAEVVQVSLAELLRHARGGRLATALIDDEDHEVRAKDRDGARFEARYPPGFAGELTTRLLTGGVDVRAATPSRASDPELIAALLLAAGLLVAIVVRRRRGRRDGPEDGAQALSLRDPAQFARGHGEQAAVPATRFSDVAGADEAVAELRQLVDYLRHPGRFDRVGAHLPRGYLLVGPPGTGKTLLARAVAGEAGVPFYAMSGAEFVETYVGVGAKRVRTLFDRAGRARRAIVFIDELDAVGRARASGPAVNDEREHTLNQLLVEMDGFVQSSVVVLGATNRPDVLDQALLRPGRFDRQVTVAPPDRRGRARILTLHARGRRLAEDVDLEQLARRTAGFTGAELANLLNQAALAAVADDADRITRAHLDEALATVVLGPARTSVEVAQRDRTIIAWHEAGHALAGLILPDADDPVQVTIVPRGGTGGVTWFSQRDEELLTARQARAQLVVALAGRAAEQRHLGDDYTQGAAHDFQAATRLARRMVTEFGMSALGPGWLAPEDYQFGPLADRVHQATQALLDEAMAAARDLLDRHYAALAATVQLLLEDGTVDGERLPSLIQSTPAG